ncbi:MAG: glycoside hydrolase family 13 [Ferruginibacter sp.]
MAKKVTFTLPADIVAEASAGLLLGEFNNWDLQSGASLKKQKDGSMKAILALEPGQTYQYRYLLNDGRWVNDQTSADYAYVSGYHIENCVITVPVEAATKPAKAKVVADQVAQADDLTKIEGIGKKIAELLVAEKIVTFKDLSKATAKKLKSILDKAGSKFNVHNPASWPKQAKIAAAGNWEELDTLQKELVAGK